ncbi:MAG: hypothetical protein Q9219_002839 [cf. Caloplaca sp. 3 TL-2023]
MRRHGCSAPPKYAHWDPILGYDLFRRTASSIAKGHSFPFEQSLFDKYGKTFQANSWGNTKIYTMDAQNIQVVLKSHFKSFEVGALRERLLSPFMEKSVFTADGAAWAHSRAAIKPVFQRAQVADLAPLAVHVDRFLDLLPVDGSVVDLQPLLKRLFLDRATEFVFGVSADTLLPNPSLDTEQFLQNFDLVMQGVGLRQAYGKFTFLRGRERKWKQAIKRVHAVVDGWIAEAGKSRTVLDSDDGRTTTPKIVLANELAKVYTDHTELRSQLLNVFFPARDTTAIGVADIFFNLARHPKVWQKLRREVLQTPGPLTYSTLKSMKYMQCVINESLRLLSPAGRTWRLTTHPCILPNGGASSNSPIFVAPGTEIHIVWWATHRDPAIWGPSASDFIPERWESAELLKSSAGIGGAAYMPFLAGPRACPAREMVLVEAAYVVARVVGRFERCESEGGEGFVEEHRLTMQSRSGVKVRLLVGDGKRGQGGVE